MDPWRIWVAIIPTRKLRNIFRELFEVEPPNSINRQTLSVRGMTVTTQIQGTMIEEAARCSFSAFTQTRNDCEEWLDELHLRFDSEEYQEQMEEDRARYSTDNGDMIEQMMEYPGTSGQPSHTDLSEEEVD
jgi:hypothetical protein